MGLELSAVIDEVVAAGRDFDVASVPVPEVPRLFERLDRAVRVLDGLRTLLAPRVAESREWLRQGCANPAEFLARRTGTTPAAAKRQLEAGERARRLPAVASAMQAGALSADQASVVAEAAAVNPGAEGSLLALAANHSFRELREAAGRAKAAADDDPEASHRRIRANRGVRTWTDVDGTWNLRATGTVTDGARIEKALDVRIHGIVGRARTSERRERYEAYRFDALVELADGGRSSHAADPDAPPVRVGSTSLRHLTLLRLDVAALRRGRSVDGELCEIAGVGPVPVSVARDLLGDSIVKLVLTRGVDVVNVTHLGRGPTVAQLVALLWQSQMCTNSACGRRWREIDHRVDWASTQHTRLDELDPLCELCHERKTRDDWALVDGMGRRPLVPRDDIRHPRQRRNGADGAAPTARRPLESSGARATPVLFDTS